MRIQEIIRKKYFSKRWRVVTENAYGMLKGRWLILFKKIECQLFNLRYIAMACITLHNLCIEICTDPCQPRWSLEVDDLNLIRKRLRRPEDKRESSLNRLKISNWLWMDHQLNLVTNYVLCFWSHELFYYHYCWNYHESLYQGSIFLFGKFYKQKQPTEDVRQYLWKNSF